MKFNFNKKHLSIGVIAFLVIVFSVLFILLTFKFSDFKGVILDLVSIMQPVIFGFIIAYILTPLVNFFERKIFFPFEIRKYGSISPKKKKVYRAISVILTILILGLLIYVFIIAVIPQVGQSIVVLTNRFPSYITSLQTWFNKILHDNRNVNEGLNWLLTNYEDDIYSFLNNNLMPKAQSMVKGFSSGLFSALSGTWNFIMGIIISIYVLLIKEKFCGQAKKIVYSLFSRERANQILKDTRFVSDTFIGFISGKILDSFIIGVLCFIGVTILKFPYAVLISVVVGITNIIPFFGPFIGAVPCALLLLMDNPMECLYFIIFIVILQQIDGNLIGPKILGDSTGISGFWVIFSITVFGKLWGVLGMFIGIPIFAVIYAMIKRNVDRRLAKKDLPWETDEYMVLKSIDEKGDIIPLAESLDETYVVKNPEEEGQKARKRDVFINIFKRVKKAKPSLQNDDSQEEMIEQAKEMAENK